MHDAFFLSHLSLRQTERGGELRLPADGDVLAVMELLLQLQALVVGVDHPVLVFSSCFSICRDRNILRLNLFCRMLRPALN